MAKSRHFVLDRWKITVLRQEIHQRKNFLADQRDRLTLQCLSTGLITAIGEKLAILGNHFPPLTN